MESHKQMEVAFTGDDKLDEIIRPYLDIEYLTRRIHTDNRHLRRYPELRSQIIDTVTADDDQSIIDTAKYFETAFDLYNEESSKPPLATSVVLDHLNFCKEVNTLKCDSIGFEAPTDRANAIMTLVAQDIVIKVPESDLRLYRKVVSFFQAQLDTKSAVSILSDQRVDWYESKLEYLLVLLEGRAATLKGLDLIEPDEKMETITNEDIERDNSNIAELFQEALKNRCYGVKNGYIKQKNILGIFIYSEYQHPGLHKSEVHKLAAGITGKELAFVSDSPVVNLDKKIEIIECEKSYKNSAVSAHSLNVPQNAAYVISQDGSLSRPGAFEPVEYIARDKGKYKSFRRYQAEILANFIDLVTPIEISKKAREIESENNRSNKTSNNDDVNSIVGNFLIPRIKAVQTPEGLSEAFNDDEKEANKRSVKLHDVEWYTRKLPNGWHASPEAIRLAKEKNVILKDGETFVRPFQRGTKAIGEIAVHSFVKRPE